MKKIFFLAGLLMLSSLLKAHGPNFGIKAGLNLASVYGKNITTDYGFKPMLHAGALAHIHINEHFALQPELLFSGQGATYKLSGSDGRLCLNYIIVPVLLQYMFSNGLRLETGPQLGALISAKTKFESITTDVKDNYDMLDFSWAFGVGYVTESGFGVDARITPGMSDIRKNEPPRLSNCVIALGLFYQFKGAAE